MTKAALTQAQRDIKRSAFYPVILEALRGCNLSLRLSLLSMTEECQQLGMEIVDENDAIIQQAKELL